MITQFKYHNSLRNMHYTADSQVLMYLSNDYIPYYNHVSIKYNQSQNMTYKSTLGTKADQQQYLNIHHQIGEHNNMSQITKT